MEPSHAVRIEPSSKVEKQGLGKQLGGQEQQDSMGQARHQSCVS